MHNRTMPNMRVLWVFQSDSSIVCVVIVVYVAMPKRKGSAQERHRMCLSRLFLGLVHLSRFPHGAHYVEQGKYCSNVLMLDCGHDT